MQSLKIYNIKIHIQKSHTTSKYKQLKLIIDIYIYDFYSFYKNKSISLLHPFINLSKF